MKGAQHILLSITTGLEDITTDEFEAITSYIEEASGGTAEVIPGYGNDESLGDAVSITIVATGFEANDIFDSLSDSSNTSQNVFTTVNEVKEVSLNAHHTTDISTNVTNEETTLPLTEEPSNTTTTNTFRIETFSTDDTSNNSFIQPTLELELEPTSQQSNSNTIDISAINITEITKENKIEEPIHPIELPSNSSSNPPIVKIIDKTSDIENESSTNTDNTSKINVIEDLNKNTN